VKSKGDYSLKSAFPQTSHAPSLGFIVHCCFTKIWLLLVAGNRGAAHGPCRGNGDSLGLPLLGLQLSAVSFRPRFSAGSPFLRWRSGNIFPSFSVSPAATNLCLQR